MKLQIASNKTESIDNGMTIQQKVNKIMGIDSNKGKESNNMKLSISNKTESIKPKKLELKISKGINQESIDLNIDKFAKVESILNKLNNIDSTFTEFLNNQNESISVLNTFTKRIDTIELLLTNYAKNQKSILDSINALHANLFQDNKKESKEVDTESKEVKTVLRKKSESKEVDTESINGIFDIFQEYFGNNNFLGSPKLNNETSPIFQNLIESIEIDSIDTIKDSISKFRSQLTKESGKYMTARKSNASFDSAIIKTIEKIAGKSFDIAESKENSEIINKDYFAKLFGTDIKDITELINEIKEYGKIDNDLINEISIYIDGINDNISDNTKGIFINYAKSYIV